MTAGRGWIALALVVFAAWRPWRLVFGAWLFGGVTVLQLFAQGLGLKLPSEALSALPYLATIACWSRYRETRRRCGSTRRCRSRSRSGRTAEPWGAAADDRRRQPHHRSVARISRDHPADAGARTPGVSRERADRLRSRRDHRDRARAGRSIRRNRRAPRAGGQLGRVRRRPISAAGLDRPARTCAAMAAARQGARRAARNMAAKIYVSARGALRRRGVCGGGLRVAGRRAAGKRHDHCALLRHDSPAGDPAARGHLPAAVAARADRPGRDG